MNSKMQKNIPKEFILQLKRIDLLSYLKRYESIIHAGLSIYRQRWIWKVHHLHARTAIQYLVFVKDIGYIDALYLLYQCYKKELNNGKKIYQ